MRIRNWNEIGRSEEVGLDEWIRRSVKGCEERKLKFNLKNLWPVSSSYLLSSFFLSFIPFHFVSFRFIPLCRLYVYMYLFNIVSRFFLILSLLSSISILLFLPYLTSLYLTSPSHMYISFSYFTSFFNTFYFM